MSKLPKVGTTIFSVMSKMATDYGAVNLSQGFPDFSVDTKLIETYKTVLEEGYHQYSPMPGSSNLLKSVRKLIFESYQRKLIPGEELIITAGATEGLFAAISALINRDDEVLVLDPSYDSYDPAVTLQGGIPVHVQLTANYLPDWEKIHATVNSKTRMLVINNPHNPSGRMWQEKDMQELLHLCEKHPHLLVLSDEVYEYITFEKEHQSIHQYEALWNRAISVSSFGKTFHVTGWKVGYLTAPKHLMEEIKKVHQYLVFAVNSVAQETLARYIPTVLPERLGAFYQEKRDVFQRLLKESRFKLLPSDGTYFQVADYSSISDIPDTEFVKTLIKEHNVAAVPISVFNESKKDLKHIRFCFAKKKTTLEQASKKLCKI